MNVGLLYTPVSIYQMTRGALVLFVGILSVIFLHRRLWLYQLVSPSFQLTTLTCRRWISLLTVMAGVSLVGYSGSLIKDTTKDAVNLVAAHPINTASNPVEPVDVTKVLIGMANHICHTCFVSCAR